MEDCPAIAEVNVRAWQQAYAHILPAEVLAARTVAPTEAFWRRKLEEGVPPVLVARDPEVVGFVAFGSSRDPDAAPSCGEIWAIYVAPARWGKGVGRPLCLAALVELRTRGCNRVTLWVLAENHRALRFYRSLGFEVELDSEREVDVNGAPIREVRCSLPLA